jgi:hypothetical protein
LIFLQLTSAILHGRFLSNATMKESRKLELLRRVQSECSPERPATPLALGFSEIEFREMVKEQLLIWFFSEDSEENILTTRTIEGLPDKAKGILAEVGPMAANVIVHNPPETRAAKTFRVLGIGLWDLVKIPIAWLIGYFMGNHFK